MAPAREGGATAGAQPDLAGFRVVWFGHVRVRGRDDLLVVSLDTPRQLNSHTQPVLLLERGGVELLYSPRLASSTRHPLGHAGRWLWRGIFPVPSELAGDAEVLFALRLLREVRIHLPSPVPTASPMIGHEPGERQRAWPYVVGRGALVLGISCQLCLLPLPSSTGALADGAA